MFLISARQSQRPLCFYCLRRVEFSRTFPRMRRIAILLLLATATFAQQATQQVPQPEEHDFVTRNFKFRDGESLPEVKIHYYTYGKPQTDAQGRTTNAVLILHGTGGTGRQFVRPQFAGVLFGPGQLLDTSKYFVVLPDNIGHGKSSKPSDGLHAKFPHYDYDDPGWVLPRLPRAQRERILFDNACELYRLPGTRPFDRIDSFAANLQALGQQRPDLIRRAGLDHQNHRLLGCQNSVG